MGASVQNIPSINTPLADKNGRINPVWYEFLRFFIASTVETNSSGTSTIPNIIAGNGLTGGGEVYSDVTLNVGAGQGITVNANDINVDISNQQQVAINSSDEMMFSDTSDNNNLRKTKVLDLISLVPVSDPGINNLVGTDNVTCGTGTGAGLQSGSTGNTAVGVNAGTLWNTNNYGVAVGWHALVKNTHSATYPCVAVGAEALAAVTTGIGNTAVGFNAGKVLTSNHNTILGNAALDATDATSTVAIGSLALNGSLSTIASQTVVGYGAGSKGTGNVSIGYQAGGGSNSTTRSQQVGVGYQALYGRTGTDVTGVGYQAGYIYGGSATAGDQNTFIGSQAGSSATTGANNTLVGYNAQKSAATVANEVTLGNSSVATLRCQVTTITALSDKRDKKDIEDLKLGVDFIDSLRPVKFTWNMRDGSKVGPQEAGFIAQELKEASKDVEWLGLVLESNPDRLEATPGKLLPVMVKAIQELHEKYKTLERRLSN